MNNYVYLAGPISGESYSGATNWRSIVKNSVPPWIRTLSPLRAKDYLKEETNIKDNYSEHPMSTGKGINTRDMNDVKRSSALLVNLLGSKTVSIGTVMEVAWAKAFDIPVICVMEKESFYSHSMFLHACGFVVNTLKEAIDILVYTLGDDNQVVAYNSLNRSNEERAKKIDKDHENIIKKEKDYQTKLSELLKKQSDTGKGIQDYTHTPKNSFIDGFKSVNRNNKYVAGFDPYRKENDPWSILINEIFSSLNDSKLKKSK